MRRSKFTEAEIAHAVKQCEAGIPVREVARKYGVSEKTMYAWRKKIGVWRLEPLGADPATSARAPAGEIWGEGVRRHRSATC